MVTTTVITKSHQNTLLNSLSVVYLLYTVELIENIMRMWQTTIYAKDEKDEH